jgi:hypothetical protein
MTVGEPSPICFPTVPLPLTVGSENTGACPPTCGIPDFPLDPREVNSPTPRAIARTHPTRRNLLRGRCARPCGKSSDNGTITGSCFHEGQSPSHPGFSWTQRLGSPCLC